MPVDGMTSDPYICAAGAVLDAVQADVLKRFAGQDVGVGTSGSTVLTRETAMASSETSQEHDLFSRASSGVEKVLRSVDVSAMEGELKLRIGGVNESVRRLEAAQVVSQELLEAVVSL